MATTEEQIKKLYKSQLDSQKEQLQQDYMSADANYQAQKEQAQKATDANLNRTAVEAQKAAMSREELNNAYGLSSGARAQSRLVSDMQTQSDMAELRAQQQDVDAEVERQRGLLAQEYSSAIRKAQSDNDLQLAQALYDEAQRKEQLLLAQEQNDINADNQAVERQMKAALALAEETGNERWFSVYAQLAGLTGNQETPAGNDPTGLPGVDLDAIFSAPKPSLNLSEEAKSVLSKLPYASNGQSQAWKAKVYNMISNQYKSGMISEAAAKEIINHLGMDATWKG